MRIPSRLLPGLPGLMAINRLYGGDINAVRISRRQRLQAFVAQRTCIYLDTKWWLYFRDARFSKTPNPEHARILRTLYELVDEGAAVCPASGSVVDEVLRQTDLKSRLATASVMDMLSCNVAFTSRQQQAIYEMSFWLAKQRFEAPDVPEPRQSVLTCPMYTVLTPGLVHRRAKGELARLVPLVLDELCHAMTYSEMMMQWEEWREDPDAEREHAATMNATPSITKEPIEEYERVLREEALGCWRAYWPILCQAAGSQDSESSTYDGVSRNEAESLFEPQLLAQIDHPSLPAGVMVIAAGQAGIRVDATRRYKPGDWYDLNHAAVALPYANAFFTESSLQHLLTHKPTKLATRHDCVVLSRPGEIQEYLDGLGKK